MNVPFWKKKEKVGPATLAGKRKRESLPGDRSVNKVPKRKSRGSRGESVQRPGVLRDEAVPEKES